MATPSPSIEALNERFAIPGIANILAGRGGLPKLQITTPQASAEIYLHGAQLTSWQPANAEEVIFLSSQSVFQPGKAIRGGIPICFPWFRAKADNPKAPAHGVVRTKAWQLESITHENQTVVATLFTESDQATRQWWAYDFRLTHRITIATQLKLELITTNPGAQSFQFEEALHTYHRIGDLSTLRIRGLDQAHYLDNRHNNARKLQAGDIHLTGATDNAYIETTQTVEILDPALHRSVRIEKQHSQTTIVWNPWQQAAESMADLGNDEWQQFACVEASNILASAITLQPGQTHTMAAILSVHPLAI